MLTSESTPGHFSAALINMHDPTQGLPLIPRARNDSIHSTEGTSTTVLQPQATQFVGVPGLLV